MDSEILQPDALVPPPLSSDPSEVAPAPDAAKSDATAAPLTLAEFSDANPSKRTRHRARSQQAGPEDVGRIGELTKKLRLAEEELGKYKKPAAVVARPAPVQARTAPVVESRSQIPIPPVRAEKDDPEPDVTTYEDLTKYQRDMSLWGGRQVLREARADYERAEGERTIAAEVSRMRGSWVERWQAASDKYGPEFERVCSGVTQIPEDSLINRWILKHKSGADVLYHLQKNPNDLQAMLALQDEYDQAEALSLLGQRLTTSTRTQAVTTGAAAANRTQPVVKPPTPVRTAPQRASDDALPDSENLSLADFAEAFPGRR